MRQLIVVLVLAVIAGLVWTVWFSSVLAIRQTRVAGVVGMLADLVVEAGRVPIGQPLIRLDTEAVADRVRAMPWVESADVTRAWPGDAVLSVRSRVPIAVVGSEGVGADRFGVAFDPPGALPTGLPAARARGAALELAMIVLAGMPSELRSQVTELRATTRDDLEFTLRTGEVVRWGSSAEPSMKARVLGALLTRKARVYDVTAPELPVTVGERLPD